MNIVQIPHFYSSLEQIELCDWVMSLENKFVPSKTPFQELYVGNRDEFKFNDDVYLYDFTQTELSSLLATYHGQTYVDSVPKLVLDIKDRITNFVKLPNMKYSSF